MKIKCAQIENKTKRGYLAARRKIFDKIMKQPKQDCLIFHEGKLMYGWLSSHRHELAYRLRKLDRININYRR